VVVIGEELSAEIIAQVTAAIDFADERDPTGGQLPLESYAVGGTAYGSTLWKRGFERGGNRSGKHNSGAVTFFEADDEFSRRNARGVIQLPLPNEPAFELRRGAVGTLAFAVA